MIDIQWNVDNVNGNSLSFADAVDSMMYHLYWALVADDLKNDAHYLSIHWLDIELDCCRNFQHIDAGLVSMVNNQLVEHHTSHWPESLNYNFYENIKEQGH